MNAPAVKTRRFSLHIRCPHCAKQATAFKGRPLTAITTELAYRCTDESCGCTFVVTAEVCRMLSLPPQLNSQVNVPLSPIIQRRQIINALELAGTATLPPEGEIIDTPEALRQADMFDHACAAHGP